MSLSDYLKYLRAVKGGLTPWEIAEGSGVHARDVHLIEVKHRRMGEDDELLQRLARFFGVPVEELTSRRDAYRKRLTFFLEESAQESIPIALKMEGEEELEGRVLWYSREAVALAPSTSDGSEDDHPYLVQRGWISDWRRADRPEWEVASTKAES
jgi:hypothetical protein